MLRSIFLKTLYSLRWQILGWGIGIAFIVYLTTVLFDSFTQSSFEQIVSSIPEQLRGFIGSADNYKSVPGYLAQQIFGLKVVMFLVVMSLLMAITVSAAEEDDGRLQTMLTLPVSRTKVYFEKWLGVIVSIGIVVLFLLAALLAGLAVVGREADTNRILESVGTLWLVCVTMSLVSFSLAMLTGKKGLTIMLASGYALFCIVMSSLAPAIDQLKDVDTLSLLHFYNNPQTMLHGLDMDHVWILVTTLGILTLLGWIGFTRRSINT